MLQKVFLFTISLSVCFISTKSCSQCPDKKTLYKKIFAIEDDASLSDMQRLFAFYTLKKIAETYGAKNDSVYAWIYLKLGKYESIAKHNYEGSISLTQTALNINRSSFKGSSNLLNINACFNIASSCEASLSYAKALNYYDSVIFLCRNYIDTNNFMLESCSHKANIYFSSGDYQTAVEESIKGMHLSEIKNDLYSYTSFLNMKAQSLFFENNINQGLTDASNAIFMSKKINDINELAAAYKTLALLYEKKDLADSAKYYFIQTINARLKTSDYANISRDYVDFGSFYLNSLRDYKKAEKFYSRFFMYADKITDPFDRAFEKAGAYLNLGENYFEQNKLQKAETYYLKSFDVLNLKINTIKDNPSAASLSNFSSNTDLVIVLLNNKTNLLLQLYKNTRQKQFLSACTKTALVTDSVITQIRHEHLGEQSKLYWRDKTHQFFINAIEACYLINNSQLAFYFMEKSRAVLLNDKLNELSAASHLTSIEIKKEREYKIKINEFEQKLSATINTSKQFQNIQLQLANARTDLEQYIKSLETKYPAYYQYKYADEVPSLQSLQLYLKKNNQSFVHYFLGDTVTYILAITSNNTKLIRLSQKYFNKEQLADFLLLCANKQTLMNHYNSFAVLSNSIYATIFQPLQLPKGRIIICADNIVIPFDALCTDENGKNFLLNDYSFSYVYSARFLMKQFNNPKATGNFLGFAPVSFASYLDVNDLKNAATALQASAAFYRSNKLFTNQNASRSNFFNYVSSYSIVSIFSHARADTTDNEPVLFMQDSLIHLSELQLLNKPATKLVLLSACQTNVGKAATGEGIYSLARGFATAGISSVAATLWKADEQTIYNISEKFNEYLSEGMNKDEALQKAKLYFIQNNSGSEKLLPYYWANMILIGNTDAINLTQNSSNLTWRIIAAGVLLTLTFIFIYTGRKIIKRKKLRNRS